MKKNLGLWALEAIAGAVVGLSGCASPETRGYNETFIRKDHRGEHIEIWAEYPSGIEKVELCGEDGRILYTDYLGFFPKGGPNGHLTRTGKSFEDERTLIVRVIKGRRLFEKDCANPLFKD